MNAAATRPAVREPGVCQDCGGFGSGTPAGCPACGATGLKAAAVNPLLADLPWRAWLYLARQLPHLDAAESLAHAAECPGCLDQIGAIRAAASRPALARAA